MNISTVPDDLTARTASDCARQRAEHLAILGASRVLELCVGPSLLTLEAAYESYGLEVVGNDIDTRWKQYHPNGQWLIGDCFKVPWDDFDAVVFAPPLSVGCTGTREDALPISKVVPRYEDFMAKRFMGIRCMVLPARTFATHYDRKEFFDLTFDLVNPDVIPLTSGSRKVRKYVDVYYRD